MYLFSYLYLLLERFTLVVFVIVYFIFKIKGYRVIEGWGRDFVFWYCFFESCIDGIGNLC